MALYESPPHRVSILRPAAARDGGGGTQVSYSALVLSVPCLIQTVSSSEAARFAAAQVVVTHTVAFLEADLTVGMLPGYVLQDSGTGQRYRVRGLRVGNPAGNIPTLVYCECEQLL